MAVVFSISLPDEKLALYEALNHLAEQRGENRSAVIVRLVEEALATRATVRDERDERQQRIESALARIEQRLSNLALAETSTEQNGHADQEALDEIKQALF